ncbi:MAG: DUF268 domain-containing protein [Desulfobacteraceae bacterium]|nr:DUF268 domain-containing protein [Desulfobacteraceae bacterium]
MVKTLIKRILSNGVVDQSLSLFRCLFFDPVDLVLRLIAIPTYVSTLLQYRKRNTNGSFSFSWHNAYPMLGDRYRLAGSASGHYFWQDLWAAEHLFENKREHHVTVGSRVDGFVSHVILFCRLTYVDIRPLAAEVENLDFRQGTIVRLPFEDGSVPSLSSLHVIEHIGLGRYGGPVEPEGDLQAARELKRVLAPGGELLIGTPVGVERLCFNAHRVYDPQTILSMFAPLELIEFSLIDDTGLRVLRNASFDLARNCSYGCGLFIFRNGMQH